MGMQRVHTYSRRGFVILGDETTLGPNVPERILVGYYGRTPRLPKSPYLMSLFRVYFTCMML